MSTTKRILPRIVAAGAAAALVAASIAACGGSSSDHGFYNMATLQASVQTTVQQDLTNQNYGERVVNVDCFMTNGRQALCHLRGTGGDRSNYTIAINKAGTQWAVLTTS